MRRASGVTIAFVLFCFSARSFADGFTTGYIDVIDRQVEAGQNVPLRGPSGRDLELSNVSDVSITVDVQPLQPTSAQLKSGSEAIPDLHWVHIEPSSFQIPAHSMVACKVFLNVPRAHRYRHRWYQVMLWSRARPQKLAGASVTAALLSRGRFYVEK